MANRGWDSQLGGDSWPSNARTTGRVSGTDGADGWIQGERIADPGNHSDPLDQPSDSVGTPGQLSTS